MSKPKDKFNMICFDRILTLSNLFSRDEEILIFDIGANDGTSALEFLEAFPKSNIVAIEPSQKAFSALEIRLSSLSRVRIEKFALSDKSGNQKLFVSDLNGHKDSSLFKICDSSKSVARGLHPKSNFKLANFSEELVQTIRLDEYLSINTEIRQKLLLCNSIMKIDTQGSELAVLKGSYTTLKESPVSAIVLELIHDDVYSIPKGNVPAIFSLLYELGYVLFDVSHIYKDLERVRTLWMDLIFVQESLV